MRSGIIISILVVVGVAALSGKASADSIVAWGLDSYGEVSDVPTGDNFTSIAAGAYEAFALTSDGSIVTWGYDGHGEISGAPTGTGFKQVVAGDNMAYALTANGSIVAWGDNTYDQVSDAPTGSGYVAISAGYYSGYALTATGSIVAWGRNQYGEVSDTPTGTGFLAIAAGSFTGYALAPVPEPAHVAVLATEPKCWNRVTGVVTSGQLDTAGSKRWTSTPPALLRFTLATRRSQLRAAI